MVRTFPTGQFPVAVPQHQQRARAGMENGFRSNQKIWRAPRPRGRGGFRASPGRVRGMPVPDRPPVAGKPDGCRNGGAKRAGTAQSQEACPLDLTQSAIARHVSGRRLRSCGHRGSNARFHAGRGNAGHGKDMGLRRCIKEPIPEILKAWRDMSAAVEAHVRGDAESAARVFGKEGRRRGRPGPGSGNGSIPDGRSASMTGNTLWSKARGTTPIRFRRKCATERPADFRRASGGAVLDRDGHRCRYRGIPVVDAEIRKIALRLYPDSVTCGTDERKMHAGFAAMWLRFDHVVPWSHGGGTDEVSDERGGNRRWRRRAVQRTGRRPGPIIRSGSSKKILPPSGRVTSPVYATTRSAFWGQGIGSRSSEVIGRSHNSIG